MNGKVVGLPCDGPDLTAMFNIFPLERTTLATIVQHPPGSPVQQVGRRVGWSSSFWVYRLCIFAAVVYSYLLVLKMFCGVTRPLIIPSNFKQSNTADALMMPFCPPLTADKEQHITAFNQSMGKPPANQLVLASHFAQFYGQLTCHSKSKPQWTDETSVQVGLRVLVLRVFISNLMISFRPQHDNCCGRLYAAPNPVIVG